MTRAKGRNLEMLPFREQSKEDEPAKLMEKGCSERRGGESVLFLEEETIRKNKVCSAISCKVFNWDEE